MVGTIDNLAHLRKRRLVTPRPNVAPLLAGTPIAMTLGITADVTYLWMGAADSAWMYVSGTTYGLLPLFEEKVWANFQCDRPAVGHDAGHPTFNFHAMTAVGGVLRDPAYDMTGQPGILKHARGATAQLGSSDDDWKAFANTRYVE